MNRPDSESGALEDQERKSKSINIFSMPHALNFYEIQFSGDFKTTR